MMPPYMSVKVRQTTTPGTTCPTLYEECVGSLTSHRFITCARACETGPTVYRPYPRRLESQTVCRSSADVITKAALSPQLFKDPEGWSGLGLNLEPPVQQTGAYPIMISNQEVIPV